MALKIAIVTPDHEALDIECDEVVAPGANGEIGLLAGHVPLITALRPGVLTVIAGGRRSHYAVSSGFAEVDADCVTILTEACEEATKVDADRARRALEQAESALASLAQDDVGFAEQERRSLRARARLDAAARR
jgi:F-type H+-transporting ATPase subunit epsilon